ncbi:MAG: protein of unknown function DUF2617 [Haloquadratum sp. J07HQX50]|jgi:Protein of unknown function DUF2617.|nr:MAG: protein of unknown function DUF2617 [Haloquadratum sp. J07HQX50]
MSPQKLYLIQSKWPQSIDSIDIKATHEAVFCAHPAQFHIVGESHAVSVPTLPFYEIFSCQPARAEQAPNTTMETVQLTLNAELSIAHTLADNSGTVRTTVQIERLETFPGTQSFTVAYKFDKNAYTAIKIVSQREYRTYHTYPEHDLTVVSCHRIVSSSGTESSQIIEPSTQ